MSIARQHRLDTVHLINRTPGFSVPQSDAQITFQSALWALAEPGKLQSLQIKCGAPEGLSIAMSALLLSLADADTPIWLPANTAPATSAFLIFHCACPIVTNVREALFIVVPHGSDMPTLSDCSQGEPAYPDRSSTLIMEVTSFDKGQTVSLKGPGIETYQSLSASGLPSDFWMQWRENQHRFPLGVDVLLTCKQQIIGLPRTTQMEI